MNDLASSRPRRRPAPAELEGAGEPEQAESTPRRDSAFIAGRSSGLSKRLRPEIATFGEPRCAADIKLQAVRDAMLIFRDPAASEMALLDDEGVVVWAEAAWRANVNASQPLRADGGVGASYADQCNGMLSDTGVLALRQGLQELLSRRSVEFVQVYVVDGPSGLRWRQQRIIPSPVASTGFVAIHEDLNDLEHARSALRNRPDQLLIAQEQERQRIAIELHDSTGQHLVALVLGIRRLRLLTRDTHGVADVLEDMTTSLREAVKEIRVLSYLLKPDGLERNGLPATIELFVMGFMARSELATTFLMEGAVDVAPGPTQHAVLRIVQEALSNAYRHAAASRIDVELVGAVDTLTVRITDDGKGMPRLANGDLELPSHGVGITSMQSRVAHLKGRLDIRSSAAGTVVEAVLPI
jgi:signal transduction histidine kinase